MADLAGFDVAEHAMASITGYVCWKCSQLWGAASHDSYIEMTCNMTRYGSDRLMVQGTPADKLALGESVICTGDLQTRILMHGSSPSIASHMMDCSAGKRARPRQISLFSCLQWLTRENIAQVANIASAKYKIISQLKTKIKVKHEYTGEQPS